MGVVMKSRVIIGAEKCYPRPGRNCLELEACSFKPTLSLRYIWSFQSLLGSKSFNHHRAMASVLCISNGECEVVELAGNCSDDLGNGTLSPCNQFNSGEARRNEEVLIVYVLHRFEGLDDPPGEW